MNNLEYKAIGIQDMDINEMTTTEGGFIPLIIWGVSFTAAQVAGGAGAMFLAGMGIGAAVAAE
jgi:hypothetical protein